MCPPPDWLAEHRNKQFAQPTLYSQFRQTEVVLDQSAGSTVGDQEADESIDRQADRRNMLDYIKL